MPYYAVHHRQDTKLADEQQRLKDALIATGTQWNQRWHNILILDPAYFSAYLRLRSVPLKRQRLSRKVQELILLAIDSSCTHLYEPGIRAHTAAALNEGATQEQIMETLELTSSVGVHAVNVGVPLLREVVQEMGRKVDTKSLTADQESLKARFQTQRGYWSPAWDEVLAINPEFFAAYTEFSSVPFREGHSHLSGKTKELIFCAVNASPSHLYASGLKTHMRNAIEKGATQEEVMEVLELAALVGAQTVMRGADVLVQELSERTKS